VITLHENLEARKSIFSEIDQLASSLGFDGEFDNGQRYAYVKFDKHYQDLTPDRIWPLSSRTLSNFVEFSNIVVRMIERDCIIACA
jgi:hypothetical protein